MSSGRLGAAALALLLFLTGCPEPARDESSAARRGISPWGEPAGQPGCVTLRNIAYDCGYSPELGISRWVSYFYTRTPDCTLKRHAGDFVPDPRLDTSAGPMPANYQGVFKPDLSGFDRGHQAPDAGIKVFGAAAQAETYYLTNITPQHSRLNRGLWADLEQAVRNWAGDKDTVWVTTGPVLFAGRDTEWVGARKRIAKPHAYFLVVARGRTPDVLSFLVPHRVQDTPWESAPDFLVSVDSLEASTGLDLFPRFSEARAQGIESRPPAALWPLEPGP